MAQGGRQVPKVFLALGARSDPRALKESLVLLAHRVL